MEHKLRRFLIIVGWMAIIMGIGLILLFLYWFSYPFVPVIFKDPKFPIINKTIKQGGLLRFTSNYCKYMDIPAVLSREFVNDLIFITPETTTNRAVGCHSISISIVIPKELPVGIYHLHNIYKFEVNPIRTIVLMHDSENFTVIE